MSGRYTELPGKFYVLPEERKLINTGTKMKPKMAYDDIRARMMNVKLRNNAEDSWFSYQKALELGIANEVARMVLPLNIYSQMYWTVNARSLMNFLSLRGTQDDRPEEIRSYPQREIQMAAEQIELIFDEAMPATYHAFVENGRVAP